MRITAKLFLTLSFSVFCFCIPSYSFSSEGCVETKTCVKTKTEIVTKIDSILSVENINKEYQFYLREGSLNVGNNCIREEYLDEGNDDWNGVFSDSSFQLESINNPDSLQKTLKDCVFIVPDNSNSYGSYDYALLIKKYNSLFQMMMQPNRLFRIKNYQIPPFEKSNCAFGIVTFDVQKGLQDVGKGVGKAVGKAVGKDVGKDAGKAAGKDIRKKDDQQKRKISLRILQGGTREKRLWIY